MLYQILLFTLASSVLFWLGLVIHTAIVSQLALWKFKKQNKGLPMLNGQKLLGNGSLAWALRTNLCKDLIKEFKFHKDQAELTFGWLFNTTPSAITIDLDLVKRILDEPNKHMNRIKSLNLPLKEFEQSIMLAEGDKWRQLRRNFAPALKSNRFKTPNVLAEIERSIEKLVGLIDSKLERLSKEEAATRGKTLEIDDLVHRYSLNLVFSCLYKQYDLINFDERPCNWAKMVDNGLENVQRSPFVRAGIVFPVLTPVIDWFIYHFHSQGIWRRDIMQFVKRQTQIGFEARKAAQELLASGKEIDTENFVLKDGSKFQRNMIDYVIDQFLDGKLSQDDYFNTSCFLFNAADKTAADAITHTLYQLAVNGDIQEKLRKSICEHGADSEYLNWVLNESLRLMPPANVGASRTLAYDMEIEGGYVLPKGTFVITPLYLIHRLPKYWGDDAEEFKPDRWQDTSKHHPHQYMPFGAGPRGCPGKEFALFEMKLLLVALLTRYKFEADIKPDLDQFDSPGLIFLVPNSPTYITIKKLTTAS